MRISETITNNMYFFNEVRVENEINFVKFLSQAQILICNFNIKNFVSKNCLQ
jgi:hypothetical protein